MTIEELAAQMDQRLENIEKRMGDGFEASRIRDEELRGLMTFGLEAREVLSDEMHRRFDEAARKHDDQLALLQGAVQHFSNRK